MYSFSPAPSALLSATALNTTIARSLQIYKYHSFYQLSPSPPCRGIRPTRPRIAIRTPQRRIETIGCKPAPRRAATIHTMTTFLALEPRLYRNRLIWRHSMPGKATCNEKAHNATLPGWTRIDYKFCAFFKAPRLPCLCRRRALSAGLW